MDPIYVKGLREAKTLCTSRIIVFVVSSCYLLSPGELVQIFCGLSAQIQKSPIRFHQNCLELVGREFGSDMPP